ncbi:hypothetical protein GS399_12765 [Pedobacter sp. HMF7647]|uniref:Uncharacterized protein n=1 Tax=Hufsiella arboris TaxID=2695275 RepID=A0A7K1YCM2_9SPHI|nr:hypothetical protein [Hufsiella arboris]MXV51849.1 hypothetical protein [Hufsiella arboris]
MKIYISSITSLVQLLTNQSNQLIDALTTKGTSTYEVVDGDKTYTVTLNVQDGTPSPPADVVPYGVSVHYGQGTGHADYTTDTIPFAIQLMKDMHFNFARTDATTDEVGTPENPSFDPFMDAAQAAGIGIMAVLSVSAAGSNPPASGVAGNWSQSEYDELYKKGLKKGAGFILKYYGRIKWIELGNELDVIDDHMKLRYGSGTGEPADPTGDPLRWASTYNGENVCWDMSYYGAYFHYIKGMYNGIKLFDQDCKIGMNYANIHYGLFMRFYDDMINLNDGAKFDFIANHWYNSDEYFTDNSHNTSPDSVPMEGQAVDRVRLKFTEAERTTLAGFSEIGFYDTRANPDNLTDAEFRQLMYDNYWNDADFYIEYELFNEKKARASTPSEATLGLIDSDATEYNDIVNSFIARTPFPKTPQVKGTPRIDPCIEWRRNHPFLSNLGRHHHHHHPHRRNDDACF